MAVGPPIRVGAVGEPPIWVGERGATDGAHRPVERA